MPSVSPFRLAALIVTLTVAIAFGVMVWRVLPLTDRSAGVIPPSALTGAPSTPPSAVSPGASMSPFDMRRASTRSFSGVRATAGIVVDAASGRVLWVRRPHARLPVASLTKLMTAMLSVRPGQLTRRVTITPAMTGELGYTIGLKPGDRLTVRDLLAATMIASANDAADALAVRRSGSIGRFVALMNREAKRFGLRDTHYSNPSGIIDAGNHSSAWDVAKLSRLYLEDRFLARLVQLKLYRTAAGTSFVNRNQLLWDDPTVIGIKTGSTDLAGHCLAAAARRNRRTLIAVVLDARGNEFAQVQTLLRWGFKQP
jgi:serine-type D-Ala-D-Ala carboxypeptidase (penicillin-binding protein 5/6)